MLQEREKVLLSPELEADLDNTATHLHTLSWHVILASPNSKGFDFSGISVSAAEKWEPHHLPSRLVGTKT